MAYIKEMVQLRAVEEKLSSLLEDNHLVHTFHASAYPISLSISQDKDPSAQMELYSTSGSDVSAQDARLNFIFAGGEILVRTDSRLIIPDSVMSKIKGYAKKMHYLYLQAYFRQHAAAYAPEDHEGAEILPDDEDEGEETEE